MVCDPNPCDRLGSKKKVGLRDNGLAKTCNVSLGRSWVYALTVSNLCCDVVFLWWRFPSGYTPMTTHVIVGDHLLNMVCMCNAWFVGVLHGLFGRISCE